ncbi:acylphosphatase [Candidatus Bipolaricaulota bacterium]
MTKRLEAQVHGHVQGVFFRHHMRLRAQALKLTGCVENRPDGAVRVIAEGDHESLKLLLQWLHEGPELAMVSRVESCWSEPSDSFTGFDILR